MVYAALLIGHPKVKYANEAGRDKPNAHFSEQAGKQTVQTTHS